MWGKVSFASMFLIIFFWMAGIMTYSYAAENLLQNPGFEEKDGWNVWGQETWIKNINSAEEKHTGSWSFKVIIGDTKPWDSTIAEQIIRTYNQVII